ncbi:vesicle-associated membrane protein-associated protein A [Drosophila grimshawi]|uniref:GH14992 n=1 Tax=Drosophila grimshawi TaxID=7222 RepID=B4J0L3_DROGR|nr:vesicle-associated membrane protein-associated protein A [Drosophila grimshawi]EDV96849.1 GH14992 [Drosophila grimshawi]
MANPILILDPADEIVIEGPFGRVASKIINMHNPNSEERVAFKWKTTTPSIFFVRPSVGVIKPLEYIKVDILVHPLYRSGPINLEVHKFMVQAAVADDNFLKLKDFWRNENKLKIWNAKIKVKLLNPDPDFDKIHDVASTDTKAIDKSQDNDFFDQNVRDTTLETNEDADDTVDKLMQQVTELQQEREQMLQQIEINKKQRSSVEALKVKQQQRGGCYYFFMESFIVLLAAILGGYVAKTYL